MPAVSRSRSWLPVTTRDPQRARLLSGGKNNCLVRLSPPSVRTHESSATSNAAGTSRGKIRLSRHGAHWFDRTSGLNILLDDVEVPRERWSQTPRYVSIALTNACELRCPFCYAPKIPGRLETDDVLSWVEELDRAGTLGVGFGGGEPTAHPDFVRICVQTARRTTMAVTFTTHAHRMNSELAAALRGSVHFVRMSMDGLGETYERIRGRTFEAFRRQADIVASVAPFGFNVVVNDMTVGELDAVAAFADEAGAAELLLLPEQPVRDRPGISDSASRRLAEWISNATPGIRLAISQAGAPDGIPLADPYPDELPLDGHAHVDARGILKAHSFAVNGVPVKTSILEAFDRLRARRAR
jgi:pyruvate-formate lyase-activating enzyme